MDDGDFKGLVPESWLCVDCGVNTAPSVPNRPDFERAMRLTEAEQVLGKMGGQGDPSVNIRITDQCEIYTVRPAVWKAAGMDEMGGCLCIGCLEKRLAHFETERLSTGSSVQRLPCSGNATTKEAAGRR